MTTRGKTEGGKMAAGDVRIAARQREARALQLRQAGATYAQIGRQLGVCESRAWRIVQRALRRVVADPLEELRRLETLRLDALQLAIWPKAMAGNLLAVDRVLAIMARRARLLGLDAPAQSRVTVLSEDVVDEEIARLEQELRTLGGGE
ncbi:MAG TPA: helix-turn-helix domain-containing protein [Actinomycetes bacterium]